MKFVVDTHTHTISSGHAYSTVQEMAREYRQDPNFKDLQVLLLHNISDGTAGIDYMDERGKSHWFPVRGFIRKPVDAKRILPEIKKHIR